MGVARLAGQPSSTWMPVEVGSFYTCWEGRGLTGTPRRVQVLGQCGHSFGITAPRTTPGTIASTKHWVGSLALLYLKYCRRHYEWWHYDGHKMVATILHNHYIYFFFFIYRFGYWLCVCCGCSRQFAYLIKVQQEDTMWSSFMPVMFEKENYLPISFYS